MKKFPHSLRLHAIALRDFFVSATYLTSREQRALCYIIALFVLGTLIRHFRLLGVTD